MQLNNIRQAFDIHVKENLNKYITSVKGLLLNVDKGSLKVVPSAHSDNHSNSERSCLINIYPELSYISLKVEVLATVFRPTIGQHIEAMVHSVKRFFIVCKYGTNLSVSIIIPVSEQGNYADEKPSDVQSAVGDRVEVEITKCIRTLSEMILHGKICRIIAVSKAISSNADNELVEPKTEPFDENVVEVDLQTLKKGKRTKILQEKTISVTKLDCSSVTPDRVEKRMHKKSKLSLESTLLKKDGCEFASAIKEEPVDDGPTHYQDSNEISSRSTVFSKQDSKFSNCESSSRNSHPFIETEPNPFPIVHKKHRKKHTRDLLLNSEEQNPTIDPYIKSEY